MQTQTPICYHSKIKDATKDSPEIHRFEVRMTGGNVLFATEIEKDEYPDMVRQVRENPTAFGF
jgi:hypothetical protein